VAIVEIVKELGLFQTVYAKMEVCNNFGVPWRCMRNVLKMTGLVDQGMVVDARLKSVRKQRSSILEAPMDRFGICTIVLEDPSPRYG
jgi:hypothetical protein